MWALPAIINPIFLCIDSIQDTCVNYLTPVRVDHL